MLAAALPQRHAWLMSAEDHVATAQTGPERTPIVYIDQFGWIDMARARLGRSHDEGHVRARDQLIQSTSDGRLVVPLSHVHYIETWRQGSERRRGEVAVEMAIVSRFRTLSPARVLWPFEVKRAIAEVFGRPVPTQRSDPLGIGVAHAFSVPQLRPDVSELTDEEIFLAEWSILAGLGADRFAEEERQRHESEQRFAEEESRRGRRLAEWQAAIGERTQRFRIQALTDFEKELFPALIGAGVSPTELETIGPDGLEELVSRIPTIWVLTELRRVRYSNPSQGFRPTDLNDLRALAVAVVHCDVVLTDKAWADALRRTDLPHQMRTVICTDIEELATAALGQCLD